MAFDYDSLRTDVAEALIAEFGKPAFLIDLTATGSDPWEPEPANNEMPITIVETGYSMKNRNATLIQVGDKMGLISTASGNVPDKSTTKIKIDGEVYSFIDVSPLKPGPVTMLYKFHARK